MPRLLLLRHAKAAWAEPGKRDFDRPLDAAGQRQALEIGAAMRDGGLSPDTVVYSPATRARETWEGAETVLAEQARRVSFDVGLYTGDAAGYLETIRLAEGAGALLLIGHNPMMEDLAHAFAARGAEQARARLAGGFPPAGLAVFSLARSFEDAAPADGAIEAFLTPGGR